MDKLHTDFILFTRWISDVWDCFLRILQEQVMEIQDSIWKLIAMGAIAISWFAVNRFFSKFDKRFDRLEERLDEHSDNHKDVMIKLTEHHLRITHLEGDPTVRYKGM